MTLKMYV